MQVDFSQIQYSVTQQNQPANHTKAICFCVDEGYLPYALFVAKQILALEKNMDFDICVCLPNMSLVADEFLELDIRFVEINISGFDNLPVGHLSLAAYHRLFLPHIFADDYEYIFYLDADTYVLRPFTEEINKLIKQLPPEFSVGAVADISELQIRVRSDNKLKKIKSYVNYYHERNHIYRNSGVLLINVQNYIQANCLQRVFTYAFDENSNLQCHDQSALNGALLDEMVMLPFTLNWQAHKLTYALVEDCQPYIIHFIGENKPWSLDNEITKPYQQAYQIFFKESFPNLANKVENKYQKRSKNNNRNTLVYDFFSKINGKVQLFLKSNLTNKHKKVKGVLMTPPFV